MKKMDVNAINPHPGLPEVVEAALAAPPVIARLPIVDQFLHPRERYTLRPIGNRLAVGPSNVIKALAEPVQHLVLDAQGEGLNGSCKG